MEEQLGLTTEKAEELLKKYGPNKLEHKKKTTCLKIFAGQFKDVMVMILLAATAISVVMGELYDALTIMVIVVLNAVLGFVQEYRTEKTLEAIKSIAAPAAKVYRDGRLCSIEAEKLVPGDVIALEAGDKVPADCVILSAMALCCDESVLTGESVPVAKSVLPVKKGQLNQQGAVYMGTTVTKGHCTAQVTETGFEAQMGKIGGMLGEIEEEQTPLQKRLGELGKVIGIACIVICVLVSIIGIFRGYEIFDMLFVGISLAVAAIPEGLPATVTIALALAVRRIYKQKALVNKLHSVETLGCTNVICTDKTGTLTLNKMTVAESYFDGQLNGGINGVGKMLHVCGVLCNNASVDGERENGDPTEIALLHAARKAGVSVNGYRRTHETPFDSQTRFMAVTVKSSAGEQVSFLKGASDTVLEKCGYILTSQGVRSLTYNDRKQIKEALDGMTGRALRSLAFAYKPSDRDKYVFIGLQGMRDPLRPEVKAAVRKCTKAGIRVVMLTGDHLNTACEIARQAGIFKSDSKAFSGEQLEAMSDSELQQALKTAAVFARVSPADKLRIVRAFKANGDIVAMTGDGVNDAPAVKEASIGVAMGKNGTDVTREAAKLVLLDDNFATLVNAVEQGRAIYGNIRKFIRYMLSCNIGEVFTMLFAMLCGMPVVLLPIQLLLINLVTDGLPAIALSLEPADEKIMERPPRKANESIFAGGMLWKIIVRGFLIGLCTLCAFSYVYNGSGLDGARTAALAALGLSQLVFVFECKDECRNIFTARYRSNFKLVIAVAVSLAVMAAVMFIPSLSSIFGVTALDANGLFAVVILSFAVPVIRGIFGLFAGKDRC